jgi:flagellar hook assembly protein FlgD
VGTLASMRFEAIANGAPGIAVAQALGRDGANQNVSIAAQSGLAAGRVVSATELFPVIPNPVRGEAMVQYSLAQEGPVSLAIYSVDGRLVRSLAHGVQGAGEYRPTWDGTDEHGAVVQSGVYFVRFEAAGVRQAHLFTLVR